MCSYGIYSKVVLKGLVCDRFISRFVTLVVSIIWTKAKLLSITLWLAYNRLKLFCGMPNLIELCYSLAYKEHFSSI